jgi:hypothetical protein
MLHSVPTSRSCILSNITKGSLVTNIELGCSQVIAVRSLLFFLLEELLNLSFPFRFIAYADDIVICSMDKDALAAHGNLQLMCYAVVAWGASVKLSLA